MPSEQCPSRRDLQALAVGLLDPGSVDRIAAHVDTCVNCQSYLETASLGLDPIVAGLRRPIAADPFACELELQRELDRVKDDFADHPAAAKRPQLAERGAESEITPPLADSDTLPPSSEKEPVRVPDSFGRFRIIRPLGQGGMGAVYLAHDPQLDRHVALKIPHVSVDARPEVVERFYRESRAAAKLHHPNICPVHDVGEIGGMQYLVMAHVEGEPLSELLRRSGPLASRNAAALVRTIALALEEAHQHGVVHRDLKPSNIMMNKRGEPVIMDFGLAQLIQAARPGAERLTQTGMVIGTPAYMSPEQVMGDATRMGPACDIYSLGVILYELLTGKLPFQGPVAAVLGQIISSEPIPPLQIRSGIDPRLDAICRKAMSKAIEDRHQSMGELARDLEPVAVARPVDWSTASDSRRIPLVRTALLCCVFLAALLCAVLYKIQTDRGTIVVDVADPSIEAILSKYGLVIRDTATNRSYVIQVGEQTQRTGTYLPDAPQGLKLEVRDDGGLEVATGEFKLTRGGKVRVLVSLIPSSNSTTTKSKDTATDRTQPAGNDQDQRPASDRATAEWVLSVQGQVRVALDDGREVIVNQPAELPRDPFRVEFALLGFGSKYAPEDVKRLEGLTELRRVQLERYAGWNDDVFIPFRNMTQLEDFLLRGVSPLTGAGLSHLENCKSLRTLELNACQLTDAACETISRMPNLQYLEFGSPHVTQQGIERLTKLPKLDGLMLRGTRFPAESAALLKRVRHLQHLECEGATDEVLHHLGEMRELTRLWLFHSEVTDEGLKAIADLRNLSSLLVQKAPVRGSGLEHLRKLPLLTNLDLAESEVDDSGMVVLGELTRLQSIVLRRTRITGAGLAQLTKLADLHDLDLSGTQVSDASVADLSQIRSLKNIMLSNTLVTVEGRKKLRATLPGCRIIPEPPP